MVYCSAAESCQLLIKQHALIGSAHPSHALVRDALPCTAPPALLLGPDGRSATMGSVPRPTLPMLIAQCGIARCPAMCCFSRDATARKRCLGRASSTYSHSLNALLSSPAIHRPLRCCRSAAEATVGCFSCSVLPSLCSYMKTRSCLLPCHAPLCAVLLHGRRGHDRLFSCSVPSILCS